MNKPLVSVVVITFNASQTVEETLNSIAQQTYQPIELIITDDASTDHTLLVCENWLKANSQRFVRVELLSSKANQGTSANCNKGFNQAQGEWIKIIAGDDLLTSQCLASNVDFVEQYSEVRILFSNQIVFKDTFSAENINRVSNHSKEVFYQPHTSARQQFLISLFRYTMNTPTMFIQKKLFDEIGGYDENMRIIEDVVLFHKILLKGVKMHYMDKSTVYYRAHAYSVSNTANPEIAKRKITERQLRYETYVKPHIGGITGILYKWVAGGIGSQSFVHKYTLMQAKRIIMRAIKMKWIN